MIRPLISKITSTGLISHGNLLKGGSLNVALNYIFTFGTRELCSLPTTSLLGSNITSLAGRLQSISLNDNSCHRHHIFGGPTTQIQIPTIAPMRMYHAKNSKVRYLDFRYKHPTGHLRCHLLIIRRQKMKKHQRRKWRRKFKCMLAKKRLKREIAKEKTFRVELLTMIRRAEQFDPREYAMRKIHEVHSKPREKSKAEKLEELKDLIREHRYQTDYVKPKHRSLESFGLVKQVFQEYAPKSH